MNVLDATDCHRLFHGGTWSDRNHVIRGAGREPLMTADDLYRACLRAADRVDRSATDHVETDDGRHKTSTEPGDVFFNVELQDELYNRQKEPTRREQMPLPEDGDMYGYAQRISGALGGKHFCLRVTDIHCYDVAMFRTLCHYLTPLISNVRDEDPVTRLARSILFVGNYAYTPFGSHMDPDPQFQYLVHGQRTAHIWTPECWTREPRKSLEAWRYFEEAETFTLGAGDAIYWPAGHYHVFESHGLSIAVTFAFPEVAAPASAEEREGLPTKHGFHSCPAPIDPPPFRPSDSLRGQRDLPVALLSAGPGAHERVVACNGHLIRLPALIDYAPIVARINSGEAFMCRDVAAEVRAQMPAAPGAQADHVALEILRAFAATHAVDRV